MADASATSRPTNCATTSAAGRRPCRRPIRKSRRRAPTASSPTGRAATIHPMMNAVGGTTLHYWAQSWRLNPWDFKVVSETTRRYGASRIPKGSTVEDWPFGYEELEPYYDKIEYEVGVSGQAGNINGKIDPRGNIVRRRRASATTRCRRCAARRSSTRWPLPRAALGWHPFPGPAAINSQPYQNRSALHVSRLLQQRRLPRRREELDGGDDDPEGAGDRPPQGRHARARDDDRGRRQRPGDRRELPDRRRRVLPAGEGRAARELHLRELAAAAAVEVEGVSQRAVEQSRPGRAPLLQPPPGRAGVTALFPFEPRTAGTACRRRASPSTTGPTTTSITPASTSSAAATSGSMSDRRPIAAAGMNTFGTRAELGLAVEGVHQGERRPLATASYLQKTTLPYEDNYLDLDPAVKDPLGFPVCRDHRASTRTTSARSPRSSQDKMEQWYQARPAPSRSQRARSAARWAPRRTPTAARAWATTPRPTSSIAGAFRTKCRTSACSARR